MILGGRTFRSGYVSSTMYLWLINFFPYNEDERVGREGMIRPNFMSRPTQSEHSRLSIVPFSYEIVRIYENQSDISPSCKTFC